MADDKSPQEKMEDWAEQAQADDSSAEKKKDPPTYGDVVRIAGRTLAGTLIVLLLLVGLVVLTLQTPWGARQAKRVLLGQLNPVFNDARLQVDSLSGNFVSHLRLYDVSFVSTKDGKRMLFADTVSARYNLFPLLRRRLSIHQLNLSSLSVAMEQQPDGAWDLINAFPTDTTQPAKTPFAVEIDELNTRDAEVRAEFYNLGKDPVLQVEDLNLQVSDLQKATSWTVQVDTLWGRFKPPGAGYEARLRTSGALDDNLVQVNGLDLNSPRSDLYAAGTLRLPSKDGKPFRDIDFNLNADPVAFRDLTPFAPQLNPDGSGDLQLALTGSSQNLSIKGQAHFSDGASARIDGSITPFTESDLSYQVTASLSQFNPDYFTAGNGPSALLNAQTHANLTGTNLDQLNGALSASLNDSRIGGQLINRATLKSKFTDGKAHFNAEGTLPGAHLSAEGAGRFFDDVPSYQASGDFSRVELGTLLQKEQLSSDLNGRFQVEGKGFEPATANVAADVTLTNSTLNQRRIKEGTASLALKNGGLSYETRLNTPGGFLAVRGRGSFKGPAFRYWIDEGTFRNVNLAMFTGNSQQQTNLTGSFSAQGAGLNPQSMELSGNVTLAKGSYAAYQIQKGRFDVSLRRSKLTFGGQLALTGGHFDLSGSGRFFQPTPSYRIDGNFQRVDIGTLTQNPQQSSTLNGRVIVQGTGTDPQTANLSADLSLYDSVLNGRKIETGAADVSLKNGRLGYNLDFKSPGGQVLARGSGSWQNGRLRYQIDEGRFNNVNVALFTGNPANTSALSGTFSGAGSGTSLATLDLDLRVNLNKSRFNQQNIQSALLDVQLQKGNVSVQGNVDIPEGQVRFSGSGNLLGPNLAFSLQGGSFSGLNIGALLNKPNLQTNLNGTIHLSGRGADLASRTVEGTITLTPSTVNRLQIQEGAIKLDVQRGRGSARANIAFARGSLNVMVQGDLTDTTRYEAEGSIRNLDLGALLGNDNLRTLQTLSFDVQGRGATPRTMSFGGTISADTLLFQDATLYRLQSAFQLRNGNLQVDTLTVRSSFANAGGGGNLALFNPNSARSSDFSIHADIDKLAPLQPFLPARMLALDEGMVEARVTGPASRLQVTGNVQLSNLAYNDIRVTNFDGQFSGVVDSLKSVETGEVDAEAGYVSLPSITVDNTNVHAHLADTAASFTVGLHVDRHRTLKATGLLDLRPHHQKLQLDSLNMKLGDERWHLLQPATVAYGADRYRVSNLLLYADDQQIALDGVVDPDGEQNLVLTIEQFKFGTVADLFNFQGLSGTMNGSINLTGPAAAPNAEGTLNLDLASYGETAGDLRLQLDYADQRLNVDALLKNADASTLTAKGYLPVDLRIAPSDSATTGVKVKTHKATAAQEVDLTVQADSFAIDWIRPFLEPGQVKNLDGRIVADVKVDGTFANPLLNGSASLTHGRLELPQLGVDYRNITASTQLDENHMNIERFAVHTGDGRLTGSGAINLANLTLGTFNLKAQMNDFHAIDTREYNGTVDGNLTLKGTTKEPVLRGQVDVLSADIYLGENTKNGAVLKDVQLTQADVHQLESTFGYRLSKRDTSSLDLYEALDMKLDVTLQRDTWLRQRINPEINIQITGNLDAEKQPYAELNLYGSIDAVEQRSYVEVAGRRFDITQGVIRFNGEPTNPILNVQAQYAARAPTSTRQTAANITLNLRGPLQNLEPTLGSGQGLSQQDIASLLGTGQQSGPIGSGLGAAGQAGEALVLGQVTSLLEGAASQEIGLDVFEINPLGPGGLPTLTAGKYLTRRFYAGIYQPLTNANVSNNRQIVEGTQITLEYQFLDWLLGRLSQTENGPRFDLFWEYSY